MKYYLIVVLLFYSLISSCQIIHGDFSKDSTIVDSNIYWTNDSNLIWMDTMFYMPNITIPDTTAVDYFYEDNGFVKIAHGWMIDIYDVQRVKIYDGQQIFSVFDSFDPYETYFYDENWNPINCTIKDFLWKEN